LTAKWLLNLWRDIAILNNQFVGSYREVVEFASQYSDRDGVQRLFNTKLGLGDVDQSNTVWSKQVHAANAACKHELGIELSESEISFLLTGEWLLVDTNRSIIFGLLRMAGTRVGSNPTRSLVLERLYRRAVR